MTEVRKETTKWIAILITALAIAIPSTYAITKAAVDTSNVRLTNIEIKLDKVAEQVTAIDKKVAVHIGNNTP